MSQIFDALQRSVAEHSGNGAAGSVSATELLQRTEAHTAIRRDTSENAEGSKFTESSVPESSVPESSVPESSALVSAPEKNSLESVIRENNDSTALLPIKDLTDEPLRFDTLRISVNSESRLVSLPNEESPAGEAFHLLGVRLRHLRRVRPLKKILVTSTIPQEGKSMVAANLACTLALRTQQRVLLLEGDVRRPTQAKIFGIERKQGICEWLQGERSLAKSIYFLETAGICIFPSGVATGNSLELLQSGRLGPMMEQLTSWFDWVVIDSPPILPLADTSVWTTLSDGILLITRQGVTQKRQLKRGLEALGPQKLIGAILNSAKSVAHTDYYYRPKNSVTE
jgi:capsular exopolysaccharide synthesis family protein